jgi:hypothetical protein
MRSRILFFSFLLTVPAFAGIECRTLLSFMAFFPKVPTEGIDVLKKVVDAHNGRRWLEIRYSDETTTCKVGGLNIEEPDQKLRINLMIPNRGGNRSLTMPFEALYNVPNQMRVITRDEELSRIEHRLLALDRHRSSKAAQTQTEDPTSREQSRLYYYPNFHRAFLALRESLEEGTRVRVTPSDSGTRNLNHGTEVYLLLNDRTMGRREKSGIVQDIFSGYDFADVSFELELDGGARVLLKLDGAEGA